MIKFIFFVLFYFILNSALAEDNLLTLKQQLDRLQREVNDLSKLVFASSDNEILLNNEIIESSDLTAFDLRIYDLEKDIKKLNSNFEELIFQIDDLGILYEKISLDISTLLINNNKYNENKNIDNSDTNNDINLIDNNSLGKLVIKSEDLSESSNDIVSESENISSITSDLTPEEQFQLSFDLLRNQKFEEAKVALKEFIEFNEDNKLAGSAHYWLGEIYLLKKEYREAALILAEGFQKHPESMKAPDMLYKLSDSLILIEKKDDACNTLKKIIEEYPNNKLANKAKNKMISLDCLDKIE